MLWCIRAVANECRKLVVRGMVEVQSKGYTAPELAGNSKQATARGWDVNCDHKHLSYLSHVTLTCDLLLLVTVYSNFGIIRLGFASACSWRTSPRLSCLTIFCIQV